MIEASFRMISTAAGIQIHFTCNAPVEMIADRVQETIETLLATGSFILDHWPVDERHPELLPGYVPPAPVERPADLEAEFGPHPLRVEDEVPQLETDIREAWSIAMAASLRNLFDADGYPLAALLPDMNPNELPTPDKRPAKWCPIHRVWMWQRRKGKRVWYSHPVYDEGEIVSWCKGLAAAQERAS